MFHLQIWLVGGDYLLVQWNGWRRICWSAREILCRRWRLSKQAPDLHLDFSHEDIYQSYCRFGTYGASMSLQVIFPLNWDGFSCKISLSAFSSWRFGKRGGGIFVYKLVTSIKTSITSCGSFVFFYEVDKVCCIFEIWPLLLCNRLKNFIDEPGKLFWTC